MAILQFLLFSVFSFSLLFFISGVHGGRHHHHQHHQNHNHYHHHHHQHHCQALKWKPAKLFVFGDSYADTGNTDQQTSTSWKEPYGMTFPGKPSGRFCNGRILTDYLASLIGLKTPYTYEWRKPHTPNKLKGGMNFAYGGTGVFTTSYPFPNMTSQIDLFQQMIHNNVYTTADLHSSAALVAISGNDYAYYVSLHNGSTDGLANFISVVTDQLSVDLKRIYELGVKKVIVTELSPLGCTPHRTMSSYFQNCSTSDDALVITHNAYLDLVVSQLNNDTKGSAFAILPLYDAFMSVLHKSGLQTDCLTSFNNPLTPCCKGKGTEYYCGDVVNGTKMYTVCPHPEQAFFWDYAHPTQEGWRAVFSVLKPNFTQIFS